MSKLPLPLVIAHRGASGYLPEHTLVSKALAYAMGADYLEQDVIATRDGALVVMHDITLDDVTDVAEQYPQRARADGHFYCIDFDLEEIRTLKVSERRGADGKRKYPERFSLNAGRFEIVTLEEEIRFIQGLNMSTGGTVGIYPEIKDPQWHRSEGFDITENIVHLLQKYGYRSANDPIYLQCFDHQELIRVEKEFGLRVKLVQLMRATADLPPLEEIARYAKGIGPSIDMLYEGKGAGQDPVPTALVDDAHEVGLAVHDYTLRADRLPDGLGSLAAALELLVAQGGIDGLFTDFPDMVVKWLQGRQEAEQARDDSAG